MWTPCNPIIIGKDIELNFVIFDQSLIIMWPLAINDPKYVAEEVVGHDRFHCIALYVLPRFL